VAKGAIGREACGHVSGICGPREIGLVAAIAGGWKGRVVVVCVAGRAGYCCVRAGQRERRGVVVEAGAGPIRR